MKGQWLGQYTGSTDGEIMVNIDDMGDHFQGIAYLNPTNGDIPSSAAHLFTKNKNKKQKIHAAINAIDPRSGDECKWEEISNLYDKNIVHSNEIDVEVEFSNNNLKISGISDLGVKIYASLEKPREIDVSKVAGKRMLWSDFFKDQLSNKNIDKFLFRGQQQNWSLRSSFHRHDRYLISGFVNNDVKQLHRRLSAMTNHYFDLTVPEQNGAFFNILQHHGYPTPLLDWSYSPFVAAFFAFRGIPINYDGEDVVRIYLFNQQEWKNKFTQCFTLDPHFPHFSVTEFIAIDNPRLVPQQSVTTVSNIYDIENFLKIKEDETGVNFLSAIDIPAKERQIAMRDLRIMGITAGSIYPSIDGVCEEMKERNFRQ